MVLLLVAAAQLGPALTGSKVLAAEDQILFLPPFDSVKPAGLQRPSAPNLGDGALLYNPHLLVARDAVREGRLPGWNPWIGAGRPIGAEQGAPFHPLNWPAFVLPFWNSLGWIALLKLLVAGLGTYLFARALGLRRTPSLFGAVAFSASVPLLVFVFHWTAIYALLPWMLLGAERVAARGRGRDLALLSVASGIACLGGHPESTFVVFAGTAAFAAFRALAGPRAERRRRALLLACGLTLGGAIGAVAILPTLELLSESFRTSRARDLPDPQFLRSFFLPEYWGRSDKVVFDTAGSVFETRAMYVGAPTLLLAGVALALVNRAEVRFWAGLALTAVLLSTDIPGLSDVQAALPVVSEVHLANFIWLAILSLCLLGAFGLQGALDASPEHRRRALVAMGAVAVIPVAMLGLSPSRLSFIADAAPSIPFVAESERSFDAVRLATELRWTLLAAATIALVGLAWRRPRWRRALAVATVVLLALDLHLTMRGYLPLIDEDRADVPPTAATALLRGDGSARSVAATPALLPNLAERYAVRDVRSEDLPEVERYSRTFEALGGRIVRLFGASLFEPASPRSQSLLTAFGVSRVMVARESTADPPGAMTIATEGSQRVIALASDPSRAWVACSWRRADDLDSALAQLRASPPSAIRSSPVVERAAAPRSGCTSAPVDARFVRDEEQRITLRATAPPGGAMLILADTFFPGWTARVGGRKVKILPANGAFRAVPLPAGEHEVEFSYSPRGLTAGVVITLVALMLTGLVALLLRRRRHRR